MLFETSNLGNSDPTLFNKFLLNATKILEENTGSKVSDISLSNIFTDISLEARETEENINKWYCMKLKTYCTAKETINKMKRQPTEWENNLPIHLRG